jgi:DNA-binding transcriptional ArsR family regulator
MVELNTPQLDSIFRALSDPTRRQMLAKLSKGEQLVTQLAEPFDMSLAAASKHIKVLEKAGLLRRKIRGREHLCQLEAQPLAQANDWLRTYELFWNKRLDKLEDMLRASLSTANKSTGNPS